MPNRTYTKDEYQTNLKSLPSATAILQLAMPFLYSLKTGNVFETNFRTALKINNFFYSVTSPIR
jgi:hypothetical protein